MFVSLSNVSTEEMETWRELFNSLLLVSTLAVCIGVYFEKDGHPRDVEEYGWGLVIKGVAFEFLFAILLWQTDSIISTRQKAEIIALELQIAPRRISGDRCLDIANSVALSSGNVKVISYAADIEGGVLAWQVANCLEASKTLKVIRAFASVMPLGGFGLGVFVSGPDTKLIAAIRTGLAEKGKLFMGEGSGFFAGNQSIGLENEPAADAIVLVATRPPPDMIPK